MKRTLSDAFGVRDLRLHPDDGDYACKVHEIAPFLRGFSPRRGVSSTSVENFLRSGETARLHNELRHFAVDFDDWCRCLHKLSLVDEPTLVVRLKDLQLQSTPYATMISNIGLSVYACFLYWNVRRSALETIARDASTGDASSVRLLSMQGVCDAGAWARAEPDRGWYSQAFPHVFHHIFRRHQTAEVAPPLGCPCSDLKLVVDLIRQMAIAKWHQIVAQEGRPVDVLLAKDVARMLL